MSLVREQLTQLKSSHTIPGESVYSGLSKTEKQALTAKGYNVYQGKVRELVQNGKDLYILHSDRLSAFDRYIGLVPYKGLILSELSRYWLEKANTVVKTHYVKALNERVLNVEACEPVKAEVIVRGYMAGSMMRAYEKGVREFCGQTLEDGLKPYQKLPQPIITPTSKAEAFEHDEETTAQQLISDGICSKQEWQEIEKMALDLFAYGQKVYEEKGWILVDTKYEFGRSKKDGSICVIDEIHTPDSSRLWVKDTYESELTKGAHRRCLIRKSLGVI
jgi:phosphoribosylaminoimidazole-succinocarboxamide synthase